MFKNKVNFNDGFCFRNSSVKHLFLLAHKYYLQINIIEMDTQILFRINMKTTKYYLHFDYLHSMMLRINVIYTQHYRNGNTNFISHKHEHEDILFTF